MNVLVVGCDANSSSFAEIMSKEGHTVFIAPGIDGCEIFGQRVDISVTNCFELLKFAVKNDAEKVFVTSEDAIKEDITGKFATENIDVFAPSPYKAPFAVSMSACKRTLFAKGISTPKFGIFERENKAINFIENTSYPILIKSENPVAGELPVFAQNIREAKHAVREIFARNDICITEEFTGLKNVFVYYLIKNNRILFFGSCSSEENNLYPLSVNSPDGFLPADAEKFLLNKVVIPLTKDIGYEGVFGMETLTDGKDIKVLNIFPVFKNMHLQTLLPLFKTPARIFTDFDNLSEIILPERKRSSFSKIYPKTVNFAEEYDYMTVKCTKTSLSHTILTADASTLNLAKKFLYEVTGEN